MSRGLLITSVLVLAACSETPTQVVEEVSRGLRPAYRVEVSLKASAEEPTPEDLALRRRIEDRIEQENIGRLVSASGGSGTMEIVVEVENTAEAIPKIQALLREFGVFRDAGFKVVAPAE
jgi:hypothetical protein